MLASLPLFGVAAAAGAGEGMKTAPGRKDDKYRVVIQVSDDDPKTWNLALNNARNVQKDLGKENVEIEIVAYGPGLAMLKMESVVGNKVAELRKSG